MGLVNERTKEGIKNDHDVRSREEKRRKKPPYLWKGELEDERKVEDDARCLDDTSVHNNRRGSGQGG